MATSIGADAFSRRLRQIGKRIEKNAVDIVRRAALAGDQTAVTTTPVDTGRARSNWSVSIGSRDLTGLDEPDSPTQGQDGALAQGRRVVQTWELGAGTIFIQNNLPYIQRLEDGYSAQAPAGMLQSSRLAIEEVVRQGRLLDGI